MNEESKDTKEIILTGEAAQSMSGGRRGKRRSRKNHNGGGSTQGAIVQLNAGTSSSDTNATAKPLQEVTGVNPSILVATASPVLSGGKVKVILKEPKKKNQKVILSVGKISNLKPLSVSQKNKSRKVSKQIKFSLKNLSKKLHTAKTIKKHSQEKSIDEIKKTLEESKLIKKDSKAPEAMIRQIYNDYMMLKHKAL